MGGSIKILALLYSLPSHLRHVFLHGPLKEPTIMVIPTTTTTTIEQRLLTTRNPTLPVRRFSSRNASWSRDVADA